MNDEPDGGSSNGSAYEDRELGLAVQHLAIQNMRLTRLVQGSQTKIQELETKLQVSERERCLAQNDSERSLVQLQALESGRSEDRLRIETLTERLNETTRVSKHDEAVMSTDESVCETSSVDHAARNSMEMEKFKEEMNNRREARHRAIGAVSTEMERLRGELGTERLARQRVEEQLERHRCATEHSKEQAGLLEKLELVKHELERENVRTQEVLQESKRLESENEDLTNRFKEESLKYEAKEEYSERRIGALKEVAMLSKQMLSIRESQVSDLKRKVEYLQEVSSGNQNASQIKAELELHAQNMTELKTMYEDRISRMTEEKEKLEKEMQDKSEELEIALKKCLDLETRLAEMETRDLERDELNRSLQTQLDLSCDERQSLSNEIALINSIFTQMLAANSATDMDLDKLVKMLQENHDLITEMTTKEDGSNTAEGLPKLLLDLINQINNEETTLPSTSEIPENSDEPIPETAHTEAGSSEQMKTVDDECSTGLGVEEIASNLPKVWRVLMELLSHHKVPPPAEECKPSCYKCIDTPSGPRLVPSVSNTYIRLKDLILEKKSLVKDLGKLKQLNIHLESKLQEQEKRLSFVSAELKKTWGVVGKLRSQYRQLHTHEQILRYELQQKRHLLTELKTELEYCREKWERAREMNNKTEIEWKQLRKEFADRKKQDRNNSAESGYSDDRGAESGEEDARNRSHDTSTEVLGEVTRPCVSWIPDATPLYLITSLKQQLDVFARNLGSLVITETEKLKEKQALDSIFSLPPIILPNYISKKNIQANYMSFVKHDNKCRVPVHEGNITIPASQPIVESFQEKGVETETKSSAKPKPECGSKSQEKSVEVGACSSSDHMTRDALGRTPEEALAARAARLKRLEEQTQLLFNKVTRTTNLSNALNNRLEELHEQYGVPNPPPLPQTLPTIRIPVQSPNETSGTSDEEPTILQDEEPTISEDTVSKEATLP